MHFAQINPPSPVILILIRFPLPRVSSYFVPAMDLKSMLYLLWWCAAELGGLLSDPRATWGKWQLLQCCTLMRSHMRAAFFPGWFCQVGTCPSCGSELRVCLGCTWPCKVQLAGTGELRPLHPSGSTPAISPLSRELGMCSAMYLHSSTFVEVFSMQAA